MCHYREHWPVLVVAPSAVRNQWKTEILKLIGEYVNESDINIILKGNSPLEGERLATDGDHGRLN